MGGWISLHRKITKNPVWQDTNYLKLWIYCLLKATHSEHEQKVGNQLVKLKPGQFVTGRFALANDFNEGMKPQNKVNERTLWRYLNCLEEWKMLSIKKTNKYSVVTINKWGDYQQNDQVMSNRCPTDVQQLSTNNNVNKGNNDNKEKIYSQIENLRQRYSDEQLKVIDDYLEMIRHTRKSAKISDNVILGMYNDWDKHPPICVEYGLKTHTDNLQYHSRKENYTLGIIRNTPADEAYDKLSRLGKKEDLEGLNFG